jgi:formamidopyrimidine-DNA glycosylase
MVDLPEALLIAKQMKKEISGKTVINVIQRDFNPKTLFFNLSFEEFEQQIKNDKILSTYAKGKWIFSKFKSNKILGINPEMGADILFHRKKESVPKKYHFLFEFDDGTILTLKYFGFLLLRFATQKELDEARYPGKMGPTPLDPEFTLDRFSDMLVQSKRMIKSTLLDYGQVPGLSNFYLNDALFKSKIHPKRKSNNLSEEEKKVLYNSIKEVLQEAVKLNGRNERKDLYGALGKYSRIIDSKDKGEPCPNCGTSIEKLSVAGSNNFICTSCQKLD